MPTSTNRVIAIAASCIAISALTFTGLTSLTQGQKEAKAEAKAVCIAGNQSTETLKTLLIFIEQRSLKSPTTTPAAKPGIIAFYDSALSQLPKKQVC